MIQITFSFFLVFCILKDHVRLVNDVFSPLKKHLKQPGMVIQAVILALGETGAGEKDPCEFKDSLVYKVSPGQRNLTSRNQTNQTKKVCKWEFI